MQQRKRPSRNERTVSAWVAWVRHKRGKRERRHKGRMYTRELGSSGLCAAENGAKWARPSRLYADPATGPGNSHRLTHIPHLLNKPTRRPRNREGADQGAEATPLLPSSSRRPFPSPSPYRALPRWCSGSTTSQPAPTERPRRRRRGTPPTTTTQPWKTTTMWSWNTTNSRPCAANRHATVLITNRPRSARSPARKRRTSSIMAGISGRRLSVGAAAPGIEIIPIIVSKWRARDGRRCWRCSSSSSSPRCWVARVAGRRGISFLRGRASRAAATVGADWGGASPRPPPSPRKISLEAAAEAAAATRAFMDVHVRRDSYRHDFGFDITGGCDTGHALTVSAVLRDGPADLAGLWPEDKVLAVDNIKASKLSHIDTVQVSFPKTYQALYCPAVFGHFLDPPGNHPRGAIFPEICKINQSSVDFQCKPFGWLIDWLTISELWLDWFIGLVPHDLCPRGRG